jgi:hypothetical protein
MSTTCDEFIKIIHDSKIGAKSSRGEYKVAVKNSIKLLGVTRIADVYNLPVTLVTRSREGDRNNTKRMMKGLKSAIAYLPKACKAQIHGDNLRHYETYVEFLKKVESGDNTDKTDQDIMQAIGRESKYLMNIQVDQNVHIDQPDTNEPNEYPDEFNTHHSTTLDDSPASGLTYAPGGYVEPVSNVISEGDSPNEPSSDNNSDSPLRGRTSSRRLDYSSDEESIEEMLSEEPRLPNLSQSESVDNAVNRYIHQTDLEMSRLRRLIRERDSTIQLQRIKHTRALSENDNIITALKNDMRDMIAHWQEILNKY